MNRKLTRGIRITRIVALAMVAAPEPISTAIGLFILGILTIPMLLLRRQNNQKALYLRHILSEYANNYRPFGLGIGYKPITSASLPYRFGEPQFNNKTKSTVSHAPVKSKSISINQPTPTVFHVFDRQLVSKQFDNRNYRHGLEGYYGRNSNVEIKPPVFHPIDRSPYAKRFDSGGSHVGYVGYWGRQSHIDIKPTRSTTVKSLN